MMDAPRILIVDDEPGVRFVLKKTLAAEGYDLELASDGGEAIRKLDGADFDVLLVDLKMMPVDGLQVINALRAKRSDAAVIILTAHSTIESAVEALRLGAFDYLFKPAAPEVIRDRVREAVHYSRQVTRRTRLLGQVETLRQSLMDLDADAGPAGQATAPDRFLRSGKLVVDKYHRSAMLDGEVLDLTTAEFDLLEALVAAAPQTIEPRELARRALHYDPQEIEARQTVKYHIHQLRRKLGDDPKNPKYIKTVRYKGYFWGDG
jgi:two-component system OmpR family response regulator